MSKIDVVVTSVDEDYFNLYVGRKPESQDELLTFAYLITKGANSAIGNAWEQINQEAAFYLN